MGTPSLSLLPFLSATIGTLYIDSLLDLETSILPPRTKCPEEKTVALLAKQTLSDLCLGKTVRLQDVATEKYGRLLANVILPPKNINLGQFMLQQRLAVSYGGGTKVSPASWTSFHKNGTLT